MLKKDLKEELGRKMIKMVALVVEVLQVKLEKTATDLTNESAIFIRYQISAVLEIAKRIAQTLKLLIKASGGLEGRDSKAI